MDASWIGDTLTVFASLQRLGSQGRHEQKRSGYEGYRKYRLHWLSPSSRWSDDVGPHFHAYFQSAVAVIAVDTVETIAGVLPRTQQRLVEAWAELHQAELLDDWQMLQSGRSPAKIEPLR